MLLKSISGGVFGLGKLGGQGADLELVNENCNGVQLIALLRIHGGLCLGRASGRKERGGCVDSPEGGERCFCGDV